ncbi:hypothetical protein C2S52_008999 [Perilla frutescens var. hirtella]|nr:hypothetical protein C2S52_008999 [Perilla frutescens var. hirtella]
MDFKSISPTLVGTQRLVKPVQRSLGDESSSKDIEELIEKFHEEDEEGDITAKKARTKGTGVKKTKKTTVPSLKKIVTASAARALQKEKGSTVDDQLKLKDVPEHVEKYVVEKSTAETSTPTSVVQKSPTQPSTAEGDDEDREDDIPLSLKIKAIVAAIAKGKKKEKLFASAPYDPFARSPVKKKTPRKKASTTVVQLVPRTSVTRSRASATPPSTAASTKKRKAVESTGTSSRSIFCSTKHAELWEKVKQGSMISEKKMDKDTLLATGVYTLLEETGLLGTVQKVQKFVPKVVSEFDCNLTKEIDDSESEDFQKVYVRAQSSSDSSSGRFLYHLGTGKHFNYGEFLFGKIISSAESTVVKGSLCYPSLIYSIMKQQKKNVSSKKDKNILLNKPLVIKFMSSKQGVDATVEESSPKGVVLKFLERSLEFHARLISEHTSEKMKIQTMIVDLSSGDEFASPTANDPKDVHNLHKLASTAEAATQKDCSPAQKQEEAYEEEAAEVEAAEEEVDDEEEADEEADEGEETEYDDAEEEGGSQEEDDDQDPEKSE